MNTDPSPISTYCQPTSGEYCGLLMEAAETQSQWLHKVYDVTVPSTHLFDILIAKLVGK